ncbi:uncharacterized protein PGTG_15290 [Puccinia graminis f. sp. tritici CRL 75-36-700-3]|uniref:Uncharacterized protein n=1 Tax=Puccinia graminis f. sp. tritici (strain CRL 75-36-700-3 / race SCCL) TaxID=418459 RepID=E3KYQ2_PUCGT|nr:uncharacterized protein PGTG_15290 [Puccinia graminis f. sp. tritici CRL 75-36-700-3]EFP89448.1 hypothetical protein PGTG_15290 [Puccinia graminis f. sp. tritici CRL 75-36-700-3]
MAYCCGMLRQRHINKAQCVNLHVGSEVKLQLLDWCPCYPGKADARNPKAAGRHLVAVNLLIASNFLSPTPRVTHTPVLFQATSEVQPVAFTLYISKHSTSESVPYHARRAS